ncbi:MAG: hypothetical protein FIB07_14830 [Candidatus Methanoperedens sp.]|nr:hypothetical protein [Candidatus Methanoperedens sp.]
MITNEIESFTCKNVLYADILGFSNLISKHRETADSVLIEFHGIIKDCFKESDGKKIFYRVFSDQVVAGFKELKEAVDYSKQIFYKSFCKKIPLRGTIGIGDFTYRPDPNNNLDYTIGSGLFYSKFAEDYHVKGHTLLIVYENNMHSISPIYHETEPFLIKGLPKEYKVDIVPWWKKDQSKELRIEIEERMHGLTYETLFYLEKTKENMDIYFKHRDKNPGFIGWKEKSI